MRDVDFIKQWEGCRLTAYKDVVGIWTIGYGHTGDVEPGSVITQEQALDLLGNDLETFRSCVAESVKAEITPSMYAALVSLAFNIGCSAFKKSTLLKRVNERRWNDAGEEFLRWNKAGGRVIQGLVNRRKAERELFLSELNLLHVEQTKENEPMAPLLIGIASALAQNLPEFINIFKGEDVSDRNTAAITKAVEVVVSATNAVNAQDAVEKIESDPKVAESANNALRANRAELMDIMERVNKITQDNIKSAREYNVNEQILFGRLKFVHVLSLLLVGYTGAFLWAKFAMLTPEMQSMIVGGVMIGGFTAVVGYWLGSSSGSDKKTDLMKDK